MVTRLPGPIRAAVCVALLAFGVSTSASASESVNALCAGATYGSGLAVDRLNTWSALGSARSEVRVPGATLAYRRRLGPTLSLQVSLGLEHRRQQETNIDWLSPVFSSSDIPLTWAQTVTRTGGTLATGLVATRTLHPRVRLSGEAALFGGWGRALSRVAQERVPSDPDPTRLTMSSRAYSLGILARVAAEIGLVDGVSLQVGGHLISVTTAHVTTSTERVEVPEDPDAPQDRVDSTSRDRTWTVQGPNSFSFGLVFDW